MATNLPFMREDSKCESVLNFGINKNDFRHSDSKVIIVYYEIVCIYRNRNRVDGKYKT